MWGSTRIRISLEIEVRNYVSAREKPRSVRGKKWLEKQNGGTKGAAVRRERNWMLYEFFLFVFLMRCATSPRPVPKRSKLAGSGVTGPMPPPSPHVVQVMPPSTFRHSWGPSLSPLTPGGLPQPSSNDTYPLV